MVFLHGGAFMFGSSGVELHGPDYFMEKDVVLVTLNYRLGAFGKHKNTSFYFVFYMPNFKE